MNDPSAINYQPLAGMRHVLQAVFKASLRQPLGIAALIVLLLLVPAAGIFVGSVVLVIGGPACYFAFLAARAGKYKNQHWEMFAVVNNWPLDTTTSVFDLVPPSMQFGQDSKFSPIIQAQLGADGCDLFTYTTTTGEGRYQQNHYFTVARVQLPFSLPHILLLSKKAKADLQRDLAEAQNLQLEGDFDDYFSLQIEKGQQIDVLTLITPDVMQTLVKNNQTEDIEILGQDLYFILNLDKRDYQGMQHLIESVVALSQQIMENISQESGLL
jgi:hypothetical protein